MGEFFCKPKEALREGGGAMIITYTDSARHGKCEKCGKDFIRRVIDFADDGKLCRDCYLKQKAVKQ